MVFSADFREIFVNPEEFSEVCTRGGNCGILISIRPCRRRGGLKDLRGSLCPGNRTERTKMKKWFELKTKKQLNRGAWVSALGFVAFLVVSALDLGILKDICVVVFAAVSLWVFLCVADVRKNDKESVTYNLLWGTGALAVMMVFFAFATLRMRLGL